MFINQILLDDNTNESIYTEIYSPQPPIRFSLIPFHRQNAIATYFFIESYAIYT